MCLESVNLSSHLTLPQSTWHPLLKASSEHIGTILGVFGLCVCVRAHASSSMADTTFLKTDLSNRRTDLSYFSSSLKVCPSVHPSHRHLHSILPSWSATVLSTLFLCWSLCECLINPLGHTKRFFKACWYVTNVLEARTIYTFRLRVF